MLLRLCKNFGIRFVTDGDGPRMLTKLRLFLRSPSPRCKDAITIMLLYYIDAIVPPDKDRYQNKPSNCVLLQAWFEV